MMIHDREDGMYTISLIKTLVSRDHGQKNKLLEAMGSWEAGLGKIDGLWHWDALGLGVFTHFSDWCFGVPLGVFHGVFHMFSHFSQVGMFADHLPASRD